MGGLLSRISLRLSTGSACVMAFAGCGDGSGPGDNDQTIQYQVALAAFADDSTIERVRSFECLVYGFFTVPAPVVPQGSARFPVRVERRMIERRGTHLESTAADSAIGEALLEYTGLGGSSLTFTLHAGPYTTTLGPGGLVPSEPGEYAGDWTCGPAVPLAHDSTLVAYGYDPSLEHLGTWRVSELRPVE
jgi:hypothetical protein